MYTITSSNKKRTFTLTASTLKNARETAQLWIYQAMQSERKITVCIYDPDGRRVSRETV